MFKKMSNANNLLYTILVAVLFFGCEKQATIKGSVDTTRIESYNVSKEEGVQILTIDSCEYVWCKNGYGAGLTHKGNCKFCAERSKK